MASNRGFMLIKKIETGYAILKPYANFRPYDLFFTNPDLPFPTRSLHTNGRFSNYLTTVDQEGYVWHYDVWGEVGKEVVAGEDQVIFRLNPSLRNILHGRTQAPF